MNKYLVNWKNDLPAGMIVFFVALPLCLGIALASGAPLFAGIIAGIVGGLVVGGISNSALGVSGPAAGLTVIVLNSIEQLNSFQAFLLAVVIAGILQILLGVIRAGIIAYYFPSSVIKGMLSAIGIIIILKQIPHALGYDADYEGDLSFAQSDGENTFTELLRMLDSITPGAILICLVAMGLLYIWEAHLAKKYRIFTIIQGPLVVVVVGIIYQLVTSAYFPQLTLSPEHLVSVPVTTGLSDFLGHFTMPDFSMIANVEIWKIAATIAIVASLETLLCVEATDKLDPMKRNTNTNRELVAQGAGNMVSGLIGGLPVTQVIIRSSANIQSGGRTKTSTMFHGFLLLAFVMVIPGVLNLVPLSVLAAILFFVGYKLAKPQTFRQIYQLGWSQFLPFITTILGVVFTDLLIGISLGMVVAVLVILRNSYQNSHFLHLEHSNGSKKVKMTLAEEVVFLNKGSIMKELNNLPEGSTVTIDMSKSVHMDYDVYELIKDFRKTAEAKKIHVEMIGKSKYEMKEELDQPPNGGVNEPARDEKVLQP
ncbi:MAG: SulP family inorganic anion transporter [Cyclobacteriaceae bacterium]